MIFEKCTEQYDWGSQLFYWAVVIKIHCVPLGCRAQFVSSAVIWQHFNPTWGQAWEFIYMAWGKKIEWAKLKNKKKLACVPFSLTSEESSYRDFWIHIGFRSITCMFFTLSGVCESFSSFEEKVFEVLGVFSVTIKYVHLTKHNAHKPGPDIQLCSR